MAIGGLAIVGLAGCGAKTGGERGGGISARSRTPVVLHGPALGLTEDNADLLWAPTREAGGPPAFQLARRDLTALHPTYLRLLVDWAALQPSASTPPALAARVAGCAREVGPCGPYAGLRAELAAIASQQHTAPGGQGDFRGVIDIFGAPRWAASPPSGCELAGTTSFARPLRPAALADYRALIRSILALGASEGVALEWWSPWNEPNDPRFISPQREDCSAGSPALSPGVYSQLVRAMSAEMRAAGGRHHLILGELNDLEVGSPHTTSVAEFIAALPADVLCLGTVFAIHAYARYGEGSTSLAPLTTLEAALDARGGCAHELPIWVTEAGAGAPHPGHARAQGSAGAAEERAGCEALDRQLLDWYGDPRVAAVFQYSFREDPDFPVGLLSTDLSHLYPTYRLWLQYSRLRARGQPPPTTAPCT